MTTRLHVTFGRFAEHALKCAFEVNDELKGDTLALAQDLSIGPLQDLETKHGQINRAEWLSMITRNTVSRNHLLEPDDEKYQAIRSAIGHRDVYLWLGSDSNSRISFMKLTFELRDINGPVFILDYPEYIEYPKRTSPFQHIGLLRSEQIHALYNNFRLLSSKERDIQANAWRAISDNESTIRVINEEGDIDHVGENYFDELLISFCTCEFRKSARIVGEALWEIFTRGQSIDDAFLGWRLRELVRLNILCYEGTLGEFRNYNIKLKS
jgi:hypothetical protein